MIVFKLFYLQLSLGIRSHNDHLQRTLDPSTLPVISTGENLSLRTIFVFLASNSGQEHGSIFSPKILIFTYSSD